MAINSHHELFAMLILACLISDISMRKFLEFYVRLWLKGKLKRKNVLSIQAYELVTECILRPVKYFQEAKEQIISIITKIPNDCCDITLTYSNDNEVIFDSFMKKSSGLVPDVEMILNAN